MDEQPWLNLDQAAARSGYRKRDLRELVESGRLPAARTQGRWHIAVADLAHLPAHPAPTGRKRPSPDPRSEAAKAPAPDKDRAKSRPEKAARTSEDLLALVELVRDRDRQLAELQEERAQLTGQLGFLLGQLSEREERIHSLEQALHATYARLEEVPAVAALGPMSQATPEADRQSVTAMAVTLTVVAEDPPPLNEALPAARPDSDGMPGLVAEDQPQIEQTTAEARTAEAGASSVPTVASLAVATDSPTVPQSPDPPVPAAIPRRGWGFRLFRRRLPR